jgi:hypothetical protein
MTEKEGIHWKQYALIGGGAFFVVAGILLLAFVDFNTVTYTKEDGMKEVDKKQTAALEQSFPAPTTWPEELNTKEYDTRMLSLAWYKQSTTTSLIYSSTTNVTIKSKPWPTAAPYPHGGAILPFKRILAFYGNLYSVNMGILGELPPDQMLTKLKTVKEQWEVADPSTPIMPAIEYIAMVAQADGGKDGMYRAVMPDKEIEKGYDLAKRAGGIYIIDLQVGKSTIQKELPQFKKYLERPDVHFAMDPEFSMKTGDKPGDVVGTYNANDVNYVINFLSEIVKEKQLPPKVLIVHRFTQNMVTGVAAIKPTPEVQVVMNMDGWGPKANKIGTYNRFVAPEPVQFTGLKLFYKNDLKAPSTGLLTPKEVLGLNPVPIYIQYQ